MVVGSCDGWRLWPATWQAGFARLGRMVIMASLLGAWGVAATLITPTVAVAQDEEVAAAEEEAQPESESYLTFLVKALGIKYVIVFLLLSFGLVALLVMCFMQFRRTVLMPEGLSQQFEQHLEAKEFQQAYELAKSDDSYLGKVLAAGEITRVVVDAERFLARL